MIYYVLRLQSRPDSIPYSFSDLDGSPRFTTRAEADERAAYWSERKYQVEIIEVNETRTVVATLTNAAIQPLRGASSRE